MKIKLDNVYGIDSDLYNFILTKKSGDYEKAFRFYNNLDELLMDYLKLNTRTSDVTSLKETINYQEKLKNQLIEISKKFQGE